MQSNRIFLSPPHIAGNEMQYIQDAFNSNFVAPLGPMTEAFERALASYTGIPYCLVLSSGTSALHLLFQHLNITRGDILLAPSLTFIASISAAYHLGAELRFIDCKASTWDIDPFLLKKAIKDCKKENRLPKAVIAVDLYGQCADYDTIKSTCKAEAIPLIIDAAEALGASYKNKHAGYSGDACILSFNGNKIITTSGGGALLSHDKSLIEHARKLSTQAREPFPYYEHKEVGFNYRISNICAAIGLGQIETLPQKLKRKREIFKAYTQFLSPLEDKISFMPQVPYSHPNHWLTVFTINPLKSKITPEHLRLKLEEHNIESRPTWKPMHLQPIFRDCKIYGGKVSEAIFTKGLCLPSGVGLNDNQIQKICEIILKEFQ